MTVEIYHTVRFIQSDQFPPLSIVCDWLPIQAESPIIIQDQVDGEVELKQSAPGSKLSPEMKAAV